jgi:hypothetical protein
MLLSLVEAWEEDEGEVEGLRGFRSKAAIARRLTELSPSGRGVDPDTVPVYVYELRDRVGKAVAEVEPSARGDVAAPRLLENEPGLGYRIDELGLEIVRFRGGATITD